MTSGQRNQEKDPWGNNAANEKRVERRDPGKKIINSVFKPTFLIEHWIAKVEQEMVSRIKVTYN